MSRNDEDDDEDDEDDEEDEDEEDDDDDDDWKDWTGGWLRLIQPSGVLGCGARRCGPWVSGVAPDAAADANDSTNRCFGQAKGPVPLLQSHWHVGLCIPKKRDFGTSTSNHHNLTLMGFFGAPKDAKQCC